MNCESWTYCATDEEIDCLSNIDYGDAAFLECYNECESLEPCTGLVYNLMPNSGALLTAARGEPSDLIQALVFFRRFEFEEIEDMYLYDWEDFLSNLAGNLGMWTGFSVLTLAELFVFIGKLCSVFICRKNTEENTPEAENIKL